jgi:class 3 adenylate cyclase
MMRIKNGNDLEKTMGSSKAVGLMDSVIEIFRKTVSDFEGTIEEDTLGRYPESCLATFDGPSAALAAAYSFSQEMKNSKHLCLAGCAVNTGEVLIRNSAIMGRTLDVVSKLEKISVGGQILFTESVLLSAESDDKMIYHTHLATLEGFSGPSMSIFSLEKLGDPDGES